jgi:hypothetical protein
VKQEHAGPMWLCRLKCHSNTDINLRRGELATSVCMTTYCLNRIEA